MKHEDLFSDRRSPYYIVSPPYTEMSSGIRVLHYLCHVLNMQGQEAYVTTALTSSALRTPLLTEAVKARHRAEQREPIVVYPEVVAGNPLSARHVVRYLLNKPGLLGGDSEYDDGDFILQYRREYVPEGMTPNCALYLPAHDLNYFHTRGVDESLRSGSCVLINRYKGALDGVPEDAVEVSRRVPRSLAELGELFRTKELLYTFEPSAACLEASLCGCAVVYMPNPDMPEMPHKDSLGLDGAAWGNDPEAIREAKRTVGRVAQHYNALIDNFSKELEVFIARTQEYARRTPDSAEVPSNEKTEGPLATALEVHRLLGSRLDRIASELVSNNRIPVSGIEERESFYFSVIEHLLEHKADNDIFSRQDGDDEDEAQLEEIESAEALLQDILASGKDKRWAVELQSRLDARRQAIRYRRWIQAHGLQEVDGHLFAERMMYQWKHRPVFHFVLFLFPGDEALLGDTLDSLAEQLYQEWRLTVVADSPPPDALWTEIETLQWLQCGSDDDPYDLVNKAIETVESDWVSFIEPGTRWRQHTLLRVCDYANIRPHWGFVYSDTDRVAEDGVRSDPRFLPDLNLDMLRSMAYCRQGAWVRRELLLELGGIEPLPGCEMHDLVFKVIETQGEDAVGHIPDVLAHTPLDRREPDDAILTLTVKNHLERSGITAVIGNGYIPGTLRVNYVHTEEESVSIIIPNRDKSEYIESCVRSLLQRTAYDNFEIVVADMGSDDPDTLAFYAQVDAAADGRVSVLRFGADVNLGEALNRAAMLARGEYLMFLKNHVEAKQEQWLSRIMIHAQRPEVGVVGPRIVYPETTFLFDAGIVLGLDDVAGKPFVSRLALQCEGYMGRAQIDQNYSAVSDVCLTIRKSLYTEVGGMDAEMLGKDFLDVDLCLRVTEAGYKVVWTPFSILMAYKGGATIHDREKGRQYLEDIVAFNDARGVMMKRWLPRLASDPAYNPNLDLASGQAFLVNDQLPLNWDPNFYERTRVLGLPLRGGSGEYRIIQPFKAISDAALQQTEYYGVSSAVARALSLPAIVRMNPDVMVVQAGIDDMHVGLLEDIHHYKPDLFRVFTLDDLITDIPEKSSVYKRHVSNFRNSRARLRKALSLCDRMIVTTRALADAYADMIDDIRVIPNRLRRDVWLPLESRRRTSDKPRIGWIGAQQHEGDLEIITDVVRQTADRLDWVFMGMCPEALRPIVKEYHLDWVSYDEYPKKMASLNLDIAVAPLEIHHFNEAKSSLRLLEYGILGWPVVCTDIAPYQTMDAPVRRVPNETSAWIEAIMAYADNLDVAAKEGDRLRSWVKRHFILEDHLDEWVRALTPENSRVPVGKGTGACKTGNG